METAVNDKESQRISAIEAEMQAQGTSLTQRVQADYFGFEELKRIVLPDGVSYIEHRVLNEGQRRKYLNAVNRDVRLQRTTGDAIMRMSPGDEKKALLESAIVGWNLTREGMPLPFSKGALNDFLDKASPRIIDLIETEIRKTNTWLQADMSVDDIDQEIERLNELREIKVNEEEGKVPS